MGCLAIARSYGTERVCSSEVTQAPHHAVTRNGGALIQSCVLVRSEPVLQAAAAAALVILFAGCSATKVDTPSVFATGTAQLHLPAHWVAVTVEAQTTGPTA